MNTRIGLFVVACLMLCGPVFGAADWTGKRIIPKSDRLQLHGDNRLIEDVFSIEWPAVVTKIDGLWLFVSDSGGVRTRPASGWVRSSEVLLLTDAFDHFNRQLANDPNDASLRWLRGICWETAREFDLAAKDYFDSLKASPKNPDACLRLARTLCKASYNEKLFDDALKVNQNSPRLYVDWGQALETANQLDEAEKKYQQARDFAPEWRLPHLKLGQIAALRENYPHAIEHFNESIRHDHSFYVAYRERAAALLNQSSAHDAASQALSSARRACELCYFREAESVSTLAQAFAALEQWSSARQFQQVAVEYAPLALKAKHRRRWRDYAQRDQLNQQQTVIAENTRDGEEPPAVEAAKPLQLRIPTFIDRSAQSFE